MRGREDIPLKKKTFLDLTSSFIISIFSTRRRRRRRIQPTRGCCFGTNRKESFFYLGGAAKEGVKSVWLRMTTQVEGDGEGATRNGGTNEVRFAVEESASAKPPLPPDADASDLDEHGRKRQTHLANQDLSTLDPSKLTPLSPEVISRQATINIGTIGHVAHGKSTVVRSLSGVKTVRFRSELERNITIKLGYANAKIYECMDPDATKPGSFTSRGSNHADSFEDEKGKWELRRHVSFVDCPGHDILMATMLNGAAVMDAALLLVAGNESCPQPQTSEHLAAVEIMRLENIIILQNKIDLVKEDAAMQQHDQIRQYVYHLV